MDRGSWGLQSMESQKCWTHSMTNSFFLFRFKSRLGHLKALYDLVQVS